MIPGETQDIALMFIPSESVYADLHERFDDIVQRAQRARVMIVSPTLMVMAIQVIKQVRKDAAMREAADQIRDEVGHMMKDVGLLGERVRKLQTHFGQTGADMDAILTSTGRIEKRGARIEDLEFDGDEAPSAEVIPAPHAQSSARANNAMSVSPGTAPPRPSFLDALAVYLKPRVLIVLFLGFSSGLPLALSGTTLLVWMRESGVDLGTIGLFALVGTPYTVKFLWAPLTDALDAPLLSRWLGRRRGWLVFTQILLMAAIVFLGTCNPATAPGLVALAALLVAAASATQDIVVDAFRVESLPENEQAAGMASYVAAYRVGMLVSTAGALFLVSGFQDQGFDKQAAWHAGYIAMAALVLIGTVTALAATEPERSAFAEAAHAHQKRFAARGRSRGRRLQGFSQLRNGGGHARLRGVIQVHRRAIGRHDRALCHRSGLHAQ